jgi:hypothetical protein
MATNLVGSAAFTTHDDSGQGILGTPYLIQRPFEFLGVWFDELVMAYPEFSRDAVVHRTTGSGPGCVKSRNEFSFSRFDRTQCPVSHDRLSGRGRSTP